jgi:hypothetical protein
MQNQHTTSRNFNSLARTIIIALVIIIILAQALDLPARHVLDFLTGVVQHTVVLLPSLALTAWQGLHPAAFEQPHVSLCAFGQVLVTSLFSLSY